MTKEIDLIKKWNNIVSSHMESMRGFLNFFRSISDRYNESKCDVNANSFNYFTLISDLYYRENFHSDVMRYLLDSAENHGCGHKFLEAFIEMINKKGKNIKAEYYNDAIVVREEGRIDVLIKSDASKRAIIVENKINNAVDMKRQLPQYYEYITHNYPKYVIDAIVYLPLEKTKHPDMDDWSEEDKSNVRPLLVEIPAFDKSGAINLVDNWLNSSIIQPSNIDVFSFLRQYSDLIKILNVNIMDTIIMKEFYEELMKENNFDNAVSIRNMLNDLPGYLALRIMDKYGTACAPFSKVWLYKSEDAVFEGATIDGIYLKMDIWCSENGYNVLFWTSDDNIEENRFLQFTKKIHSLDNFEKSADCANRIMRHFDIREEDKLYSLIDSLKRELQVIS